MLNRIEQVENEVGDMLEGWRGVEGGKSLQGACERHLEERVCLYKHPFEFSPNEIAGQPALEGGRYRLSSGIFEHATRMLNHPGESLLFQPDFHYVVERVNFCIEFSKAMYVCYCTISFLQLTHLTFHHRDTTEKRKSTFSVSSSV